VDDYVTVTAQGPLQNWGGGGGRNYFKKKKKNKIKKQRIN